VAAGGIIKRQPPGHPLTATTAQAPRHPTRIPHQHRCAVGHDGPKAGERLFNDDPAHGSPDAPDLLGRQQYAQHAVALLNQVREQSESGVLALIGPWGSGKSSVLQMTAQHLKHTASGADTNAWSVAELNPWMYSDLESLTLALFSEIRAALPHDSQWSELRRKIGAFGQSISPLGKLTGLLGLDSSDMIKIFADRISGDTSASAAKRTAETALRQAVLPVLVVMDDLDRLTPAELLVVFKLIRLVGHLRTCTTWSASTNRPCWTSSSGPTWSARTTSAPRNSWKSSSRSGSTCPPSATAMSPP
jgi:energy-coupling factor transporter ATP-binding protein EcfA2